MLFDYENRNRLFFFNIAGHMTSMGYNLEEAKKWWNACNPPFLQGDIYCRRYMTPAMFERKIMQILPTSDWSSWRENWHAKRARIIRRARKTMLKQKGIVIE